jgi:hypothetical protein
MWEKLGKMQGAIVLAVIGSAVILLFMIAMAIVAAVHGKWDMADKWLTMLFTQATGVFFGFLYMKTQQPKSTQP